MRITLIGAMIGVGCAFAIVIGVGLQFDRQLRAMPDFAVGLAAVFILVLVTFAITIIVSRLHLRLMGEKLPPDWTPGTSRWFGSTGEAIFDDPDREDRIRTGKAQSKRNYEAYLLARKLRVAALATDPDAAKRKYASLVERGEQWNDDQIAYNENLALTGTCVHLQPVERAIRIAGIRTRLGMQMTSTTLPTTPNRAWAICRVNEPELRRAFALAPTVKYREGFQPERGAEDNPWASLNCAECGSSIEVVHPNQRNPDARWFPSAP